MKWRKTDNGSDREWPIRWKEMAADVDASPDERLLSQLFSAAGKVEEPSHLLSATEEWRRFGERRSSALKRRRVVRFGVPAMASAAIVLALIIFSPDHPEQNRPQPTQTRHQREPSEVVRLDGGEEHVVFSLASGKTVELSAGTVAFASVGDRAKVLLKEEARVAVLQAVDSVVRLQLVHGEMLAYVRPGVSQLFVVEAGAIEVRVTGTVFGVRVAGDNAEVTVWRGSVRVSHEGEQIAVHQGERAVVGTGDGKLIRREQAGAFGRREAALLGVVIESTTTENGPVTVANSDREVRPHLAINGSQHSLQADAARALPAPSAPDSVATTRSPSPSTPTSASAPLMTSERAQPLDPLPDHSRDATRPHRGPQAEAMVPAPRNEKPVKGRSVDRTVEPPLAAASAEPAESETTLVDSESDSRPVHHQTGPQAGAVSTMTLDRREMQFLELSRGADESAANALFSLGALRYDRLNDRQGAIDAWREYIDRFPQGALRGEVHAALFEALLRQGKSAAAVAHGEAALEGMESATRRRRLMLELAEVLLNKLDDSERAQAQLVQLTGERDPIGERATFLLAGARARSGDVEGAREMLRKYLEWYPEGRFRNEALEALKPISTKTEEEADD